MYPRVEDAPEQYSGGGEAAGVLGEEVIKLARGKLILAQRILWNVQGTHKAVEMVGWWFQRWAIGS